MHIYSLLAPASKKLRGGNQDDPFDECVYIYIYWASQVALVLKNPPANAADDYMHNGVLTSSCLRPKLLITLSRSSVSTEQLISLLLVGL